MFQNTYKMVLKCLPGGLWAALGPRPCFQTLPGAVPERLWQSRGVPKILLGGLKMHLERKVDRFHPPGGSPGGPLREFILGAFLHLGRRSEQKGETRQKMKLILHAFITASVCVLFASGLAGAKAQLKRWFKQ